MFDGHIVEIVIVLVVVLIIWGPGKLPSVGAGLGKALSEFRKASTGVEDVTKSVVNTSGVQSNPTAVPGDEEKPPTTGTH